MTNLLAMYITRQAAGGRVQKPRTIYLLPLEP